MKSPASNTSNETPQTYEIKREDFDQVSRQLIALASDPGMKPSYGHGVIRALTAFQQLINGEEATAAGMDEQAVFDPAKKMIHESPLFSSVKQIAIAYLEEKGGRAPASEVLKVTRAAGYTDNYVKKARPKMGVATQKIGFGSGSHYVWSLEG